MEPSSTNVAHITEFDSPVAVDGTGLPAVGVRLQLRKRRKKLSTKGHDRILKDLTLYLHELHWNCRGKKIHVLSIDLPGRGRGGHGPHMNLS